MLPWAHISLATTAANQDVEFNSCNFRVVVWAHHKTGTVMGRFAVRHLNSALREHCKSAASFECKLKNILSIFFPLIIADEDHLHRRAAHRN